MSVPDDIEDFLEEEDEKSHRYAIDASRADVPLDLEKVCRLFGFALYLEHSDIKGVDHCTVASLELSSDSYTGSGSGVEDALEDLKSKIENILSEVVKANTPKAASNFQERRRARGE